MICCADAIDMERFPTTDKQLKGAKQNQQKQDSNLSKRYWNKYEYGVIEQRELSNA